MKSLLFIPGYGGSVDSVIHQLRSFTKHYHIYTIQFSLESCILCQITFRDDDPVIQYVRTLEYVDFVWLDEALEALKGRELIVCGCSYGAYELLKYLQLHPRAKFKVVLICPFGLTRDLGPIGYRIACAFKCCLCCFNAFGARQIAQRIRCSGCHAYWEDEPIWDVLDRRKLLLVYGQNDQIAPPYQGEFVKAEYPENCILEVVPGMGHLDVDIPEETLAKVARMIVKFDATTSN